MIKLAVVAAFVELLYVIVSTYFPALPIPKELIQSAVLIILAFFGVDVVEFAAQKAVAKLRARGLWK